MPTRIPLDTQQRFQNAAWGAQDLLTILEVPTGADAGLVGQVLLGRTLTTAGVYKILVPLAGITTTLQVHLRATFASGTVSSAGPDGLYYVSSAKAGTTFTAKTTGTGDGSLSTTVIQTTTLATFNGEQYALVEVTIGSSTSALFTLAEYNGM